MISCQRRNKASWWDELLKDQFRWRRRCLRLELIELSRRDETSDRALELIEDLRRCRRRLKKRWKEMNLYKFVRWEWTKEQEKSQKYKFHFDFFTIFDINNIIKNIVRKIIINIIVNKSVRYRRHHHHQSTRFWKLWEFWLFVRLFFRFVKIDVIF